MKTFVLTVSEYFPKTHSKSGLPTGFPLAIKHYNKIHTIRGNYELWAKRIKQIQDGEAILSVRIWSGKPYNSKQVEIFRYDSTHGIGVQKLENFRHDFLLPTIDGKYLDFTDIAKNDGLSFEDFNEWFKDAKDKPMAVIHFTDFRY